MPSGPALHTLSNLMAKSFCLHAARLGPANRQALERLVPELLQALLHAGRRAALQRFQAAALLGEARGYIWKKK